MFSIKERDLAGCKDPLGVMETHKGYIKLQRKERVWQHLEHELPCLREEMPS